jgi:L-rhamnose mutarotase
MFVKPQARKSCTIALAGALADWSLAVGRSRKVGKGAREMAEFVGLRTRLKPGMEEAYDNAHAAVWPELLAAQRELGIRRWLIFRDGLDLFHSIECDDYDHAIAELAKLPINQRWQAEMAHFTDVAHDYSGASADRLKLIFNAG